MSCRRAKALREGLAEVWNLPHEKELVYTWSEWVIVLLDKLNQEMRDKLMFIWWRAWHHRNNVIFSDGKASVQTSICYLQNYLATLKNLGKGSLSLIGKGRQSWNKAQVQNVWFGQKMQRRKRHGKNP
jgi:hypothetical protein